MTPPRPSRLATRIACGLLLASAAFAPSARAQEAEKSAAPAPDDELRDGLPGVLPVPTRKQIEDLLRKLDRGPVTPESIDRIDALFRPYRATTRKFEDLVARLADAEFVAKLDGIAKDLTGKPADARALIYRSVATGPTDDVASIREMMKSDLDREAGDRKTFVGRVSDFDTGRPIEGAVVSVFSGMLARTDDKGQYRLKYRKTHGDGMLLVNVEARGYALVQTGFNWGDLQDEERADFRMRREIPFRGRVVDPQGKPIAGADLDLWIPTETVARDAPDQATRNAFAVTLKTRTDAEGNWAFRGVPPEMEGVAMAHSLSVSHKNYQARQKIYTQNELLGPGWEITLELGRVLVGEVVDEAGKPVPGAAVQILSGRVSGSPTTTTDDSGHFRFENLPAVEVQVNVRPRKLMAASESVTLKAAGPTEVKIVAKEGVYLVGKVIGEDGKPAPNAMVGWLQPLDVRGNDDVNAEKPRRYTHADDDGTFRLGPLARGRYKVTALVEPPRAIGKAEGEAGGKEFEIRVKPDR